MTRKFVYLLTAVPLLSISVELSIHFLVVQATALGLLVEPSSPLRSLAGDVLVIAGEDTRLSTNHHVVAALKGRRFRRILYEAKDVDDPDVETLPMGWQLGVGASALGSDYVDAQLRAAADFSSSNSNNNNYAEDQEWGQPRKQQPRGIVASEYRYYCEYCSKYYHS